MTFSLNAWYKDFLLTCNVSLAWCPHHNVIMCTLIHLQSFSNCLLEWLLCLLSLMAASSLNDPLWQWDTMINDKQLRYTAVYSANYFINITHAQIIPFQRSVQKKIHLMRLSSPFRTNCWHKWIMFHPDHTNRKTFIGWFHYFTR